MAVTIEGDWPDAYRVHRYLQVPYQFDSVIHFDKTTAVQPLDMNVEWQLENPL